MFTLLYNYTKRVRVLLTGGTRSSRQVIEAEPGSWSERMERYVPYVPQGSSYPGGSKPVCRCHDAAKGDTLCHYDDKLYCQVACIAKWTFESPISIDALEQVLDSSIGRAAVHYFGWAEKERKREGFSSVFHIYMVDEREAASHWLDPRLGEDWKLASWGWLPPIIPEKTWVCIVSCAKHKRVEQLHFKLGIKPGRIPIREAARWLGDIDMYLPLSVCPE